MLNEIWCKDNLIIIVRIEEYIWISKQDLGMGSGSQVLQALRPVAFLGCLLGVFNQNVMPEGHTSSGPR